jgi:putative transposase
VSETRPETSAGSCRCRAGAAATDLRNKKTAASDGRWAFLYLDEAEFHLNPGLARCWSPPGERIIVPSAGQNRRVPVFGALDAMTGEASVLLTSKKRSSEFLQFLPWLVDHLYAERERIYLFLDNCSIHHTKAVQAYFREHRQRIRVIWNATYTPNLNLIERFWGHLKRSAIHNYYFETVDNLERAIMDAVLNLNRRHNHPLRLKLHTLQDLLLAA